MLLRSFKISQKLYLGFGIITMIMVVVLGYTYMNFKKVSQVVDINLSTYQVLRESDAILTSLINMETGSRGYTITGDDKFLEPFNAGKADFQIHYEGLKSLISKNQLQQDRLEDLKKQYLVWFDFESDILAKKRVEVSLEPNSKKDNSLNNMSELPPDNKKNLPEDFNRKVLPDDIIGATDLIRSGKGRDLMVNLQSILAKINNEEKTLLGIRSENLKTTESRTYKTILFGGIIATILAILISFFTSLSITKWIKMLITSTENITKQNYQKPIKFKADRELEALIKNFNSMQIAIQIREDELSKKNEAIKVKMIEANEANRLKSQFLANMSHELRTPLNSIIGFTNRVIKKTGDILPAIQLENLKIVKEEAYHLLDLISNLLDYSKVEAGKMSLNLETFDLINVIEEVNNMTKTLMDGKTLEYKYEAYSTGKIMITSDRIKIKQIFINLLSNAIKYSERGTIKFSVSKPNNYAYSLKVEDEGIGIATENIVNIFDEFRQIDGSYTRKVGGTGLGLSITKKFVQMLGGRIELKSSLGEGSCFTVYLPIETKLKGIKEKVNVDKDSCY